MEHLGAAGNGYQSRVWTSTKRVGCWGGAWLLATALMRFGPIYLWKGGRGITLLAAGLDLAVGVGLILANKAYIGQLDELQQRVYLNALAITVAGALIVGVPYWVMSSYHVIPFHSEIWHVLMLMSVTFVASMVYGTWRYR